MLYSYAACLTPKDRTPGTATGAAPFDLQPEGVMTQIDKDKLFAELAGLAEHDIEVRLTKGLYHPVEKQKLVEFYLDQKALMRSQALQSEQTDIARSAKDAAWAAVETAQAANTVAIFALIIAIISVIISVWKV